jgi:hypothetical protein
MDCLIYSSTMNKPQDLLETTVQMLNRWTESESDIVGGKNQETALLSPPVSQLKQNIGNGDDCRL